MKTKVTLEQHMYNHWLYTVYMKRDDDSVWTVLQCFEHNERKKAMDYARDLATVHDNDTEVDIWESEQ
jgi:hypothetical protein